MDKKSKNTLIVSIIALALVLIGVTYAYFSARITGLESASTISLTAGRMGIVYSEDDATVSVSNIYPRSEEWITKTITLTGTNTTDQEMKYELGLNIIENTFKGGQLTFDLTGVGSNGTKIADITGKSITKSSGFFKFGTGVFANADGDTHVYTLKIYFKDNGKDQNINQEAVFNAKIHVREQGTQVARAAVNTSNQNHNGKHCYTNAYVEGVTPANGTEYVNGQYTYRYNMYRDGSNSWAIGTSQNGWGVMLTDKTSTDPVTTELCAYINEKPVVKMSFMFYNSQSTSIDLSSFDTSNVINMNYMFYQSQATSLDLSSFDTSSVTNMSSMFYYSQATSIDLSSFDTSNVTNMSSMFSNSQATSLDLSSFDTSNVTNMSSMFQYSQATSLDLSSFDTSNVIGMGSMFDYSQATSIDLSSFDTSKVTNMQSMFRRSQATSLDLSSFDTSNVTSMSTMFYNSQATNLELSSFDTSRVATMSEMFRSSQATSIDLSSFGTSNVTSMFGMFASSQATSLDLSSFDTSNVTNMALMFNGCLDLTTIYVSDMFVVSSLAADSSSPININGSYRMFLNSTGLVGGAGTTYDSSHINKEYARIDGGPSNPGYFTNITDKPST